MQAQSLQRIGTGWMVWCSNPGRDKRLSLLQNRPDRLWGSPSLLLNGYRGSYHGPKQPGREVDHFNLVQKLLCFPYMSSWNGQGQLYLHVIDKNYKRTPETLVQQKINTLDASFTERVSRRKSYGGDNQRILMCIVAQEEWSISS